MNNVETFYPLSELQKGMLVHTLYSPNSAVYFCQLALDLGGDVNLELLNQAWQKVVDNNAILRTSFLYENLKEPMQIVNKKVKLPFEVLDWSMMDENERQISIESFLKDERTTGFDIKKAPLMKVTVIKCQELKYKFIWSFHHIIIDGWSSSIILKEFFSTYQSLIKGESFRIQSVAPFRNYIVWLRNQDKEKAKEFWAKYMNGYVQNDPLNLGSVEVNTNSKEVHADKSIYISKEITEKITATAQANHVTINTIMQGIWALLLNRYSGEEDIVFGSTVSGRPAGLNGIENMVGLFINGIPVRIKLSEEETFISLINRIQKDQIESRQFDYCSLTDIQQWAGIPKGKPIFETLLVFENYPVGDSRNGDGKLEISNVNFISWTNFPLEILVLPGDALQIQIKYDKTRLKESMVLWILNHFERMINEIANNPNIPIHLYKVLEESEFIGKDKIVSINDDFDKFTEEEINQSIYNRFEKQVDLYSDKLAIKSKNYQWSYKFLNEQVNKIAISIIENTECDNRRIGLVMKKDAPMIASLLAILKTGNTYVPLDPMYPVERLQYMLKDSGVSTIVTDNTMYDFATKLIKDDINIINVSNVENGSIIENIQCKAGPDNLAYVLYTSGSTGMPKGIMQSNKNVLNQIKGYTNSLHICSEDKLSYLPSYSHDASLMDMFGALLNGATVFPIDIQLEGGKIKLDDWIKEEGITIYHSTPTLYRYFINSTNDYEKLSNIRLVVLGGEEVTSNDFNLYKKYLSDKTIFCNLYGSSESSVSLTYFASKDTEVTGRVVPSGYPVEGIELLLLDSYGRKTEVYGEVAIKSSKVTLGYLNKPEMNSKAFMEEVYETDKRIYRTGDIGRILPNGALEFIGRKDLQIKIRGFRIEIGEIEEKILQLESVKEAAVVVHQYENDDKRLVAFIVQNESGTKLSDSEIKDYLRSKLPTYMIPYQVVNLDKMPLTPSKKIDRKSLLDPKLVTTDFDIEYEEAEGDIECAIENIWKHELNLDKISVNSNFFDLGGHSLLMFGIQSSLAKELNIELNIVELFNYPTISSLASYIKNMKNDNSDKRSKMQDRVKRQKEIQKKRARQRKG